MVTPVMRVGSQSRGEATRSDILDVARRAFAEHGYHGTGIADIQAATGLTKGAFYHHYRSKEDLALAIIEQAKSDYDAHLIGPSMAGDSPGKRVAALIDKAVELNLQPAWCNCQMLMTLAAELTAADDRLRQAVQGMHAAMFELLREQLEAAHAAGELNPGIEPAGAAQWIGNTLAGLLLAKKLDTARVEPHAVMDMLKRAILKPAGK